MTSFKNLIALGATALFMASCSPYPPEAGPVLAAPGPDLVKIRAQQSAVSKAEAKAKSRAEARRKAAAKKKKALQKRAKERRDEIAKKKTTFEAPSYREPIEPKPVKKKPKYPTAKPIPGKPGFVFNPYTYEQVDVRGIPGGSTVIDPNDPDKKNHRFKVP